MTITPAEVVVGGVVYLLAQDPHLQLLAEVNDKERFVEACHGNDWDSAIVRSLVILKESL